MRLIFLLSFIAAWCGHIESAPSDHDVNPKSCVTPKKEAGYCIAVHKCPSIMKIIHSLPKAGGGIDTPKPNSEQDKKLQFVRNSRCEGPHEYSVCCSYENEEGCGVFDDNKLIGGIIPMIDAFPWLAIVEYKRADNTTELACGGSLIGKKHVLTAASCLPAEKPTSIRLGEFDTNENNLDCTEFPGGGSDCADPTVTIPVIKVIAHPEYDAAKGSHDLAVITLENEVKYTDFIKPVCLPSSDASINNVLRVSGWNLHQNTPPHGVKHQGDADEVPLDSCRQTLGRDDLTEDHICAKSRQNNGRNTVDCGGPIMHISDHRGAHQVIGVASTLKKDLGTDGELVVYTKVSSHIDWIRSAMLQ